MIVKGGDDLRQEVLATQLISKFYSLFQQANLELYLRPYDIIVTSPNSGFLGYYSFPTFPFSLLIIVEFIPNTISLDGLKKKFNLRNLNEIYLKLFPGEKYKEAQINFIRSFAAYALVTYFLQIKDRHNGNILIDSKGHIIHIDFGFMLSISPGGINFESAPFKFTLVTPFPLSSSSTSRISSNLWEEKTPQATSFSSN